MAITAAMVKELRDKTGAGMMDCKKALTECEADVEKALDWLRQKGLSKAAKRADRATSEGVIACATAENGKVAAIVEVMTETDFVARGEKFQGFAKSVAEEVAANAPENLDAFQDRVNDLAASTGEKTVLGRFVRMHIEGEGLVGAYVHSNGKLAVLVEVNTDKSADENVADFAKNVAMQIAASNPLALDASSLDPALLEREREVYRQKALAEGKPEKIIDKIAEGAVKKYCKEVCLLDQAYIRDDKMSVQDLLKATAKAAGCSVSLGKFVRIQLGA
ncbi:translation elongation factor Ts [uncultured Mailhella sp.]|uniref:translation elongation factor Ts n=1 Tax=uncultured Mailhella sp. TaxID=1981031 RepID=UPI0025E84B87|nr:translation elongation factor Ts [uncultured Mailhella sp.]